MPRIPHSLQVALAWLVVLLAYDAALNWRLVPHPTITEDIRAFARDYPAAFRAIYVSACTALYIHFLP